MSQPVAIDRQPRKSSTISAPRQIKREFAHTLRILTAVSHPIGCRLPGRPVIRSIRAARCVRGRHLAQTIGVYHRILGLQQAPERVLFARRGARKALLHVARRAEYPAPSCRAGSASATSRSSGCMPAYPHQWRRCAIICLISAIALAGFRSLGQASVQFMMVWQRYSRNGSSRLSRRSPAASSRLSTIQR